VADDAAELEAEEPLPPPLEIAPEDVAMLLLSVPERLSDQLLGLAEPQLAYRHGPAFPTAEEIARHLALTGAELDAQITAAALGEAPAGGAPDGAGQLPELLKDWQRRRRRAADLLRGAGPERWEGELKDLCERGLQHELGHLTQLRNLTALIPVA
jgi:hypothetical protein